MWYSMLFAVPQTKAGSSLQCFCSFKLISGILVSLKKSYCFGVCLFFINLGPSLQRKTPFDPLLFPYSPNLGAVISCSSAAESIPICDSNNYRVRITFFDFSSAFNTIEPLLLRGKLQEMSLYMSSISWITDRQLAVCEIGQRSI